ncbi:hypothetical protein KBB12_00630 [Candidatus Woesebacteria bacterium]|nr:hypothetical protein [Candidatus Woesebacteria bacterium]
MSHTSWNHELAQFILSGGNKLSADQLLIEYQADTLSEVQKKQESAFKEYLTMSVLYHDVELPISTIINEMHAHGILIDTKKLAEIQLDLIAKRAILAKRITDRLGEININSPKQLGEALVEKFKITLSKTKTGQFSTSVSDLTPLATTYPVVRDLLDHRAVDKVISTYINPIFEKVEATGGRIHPTYDQMSAATGRLASHDPNIQSTPIGPPYGDMIRSTFIAPPKSVLIGLDYSQQELRVLAHLSRDTKLMEAFQDGHDVHEITASRIFDIPVAEVSKELRSIGKTLNFGIIYGQTSYGLSAQLGKSVEECAHILKTYYETYAGVKKYFDNLLTFAKLHGYVETILGRRRGVPGLPYGKSAKFINQAQERVLKNFPIQGSAADMTKKAMVAVHDLVLPKYPKAHLIMQIHDELVFEFESQNEKEIREFVVDVEKQMKEALPLNVPIVVDWKAGKNWKEL